MASMPDVLAELTFDAWLLAQVAKDATGNLVDGRIWERTVSDLLRRSEFSYLQGSGTTTLFGHFSASGAGHEIDAAAAGRHGAIILECKSRKGGVTKADVALFHQKLLDFYCSRPWIFGRKRWWRLMVSSSPVSDSVRAFCIQLGLVLCDPVRLPLPMVVGVASRPTADVHLRETLLQEMVRMGEIALMPMQDRWTYDPIARDIRFAPRVLKNSEVRELLWLQKELGSDILDLYDRHRPGLLERLIAEMDDKFRKFA